jgi:hypothetical protein
MLGSGSFSESEHDDIRRIAPWKDTASTIGIGPVSVQHGEVDSNTR